MKPPGIASLLGECLVVAMVAAGPGQAAFPHHYDRTTCHRPNDHGTIHRASCRYQRSNSKAHDSSRAQRGRPFSPTATTPQAGGITQDGTQTRGTTTVQMYTESLGQLWSGPGSVWSTPIAINAAIDPESANLVAVLDQYFPGRRGDLANFTINGGGYLYIAQRNTQDVTVTLTPGATDKSQLQQVFNQVPFPSNAEPSPNSDERMAIFQPSTHCFWDLHHLQQVSGSWQAAWGGRDCNVLSDPGVYRNVTDSAGNVLEGNDWGAPASGFPGMAGAMMVDELAHGAIPHALSFALDSNANCAGIFNAPAERTDGKAVPTLDSNGEPTNCVPEGARFRLPPPCPAGMASTPGVCYNLSDLAGDPPIVTEMAAAAQTYGMIDENSTYGGGVGVESGDAQGAPYQVLGANPYTTAIAGEANTPFLGHYLNQTALALFPWSWLELVQMHIASAADPTIYTEPDPPAPLWPTN